MANNRSNYAFLSSIKDPQHRAALKTILDRLANVENLAGGIGEVNKPLSDHLDSGGNRLTNLATPTAGSDAVTLDYLKRYVEARTTLVVAPPPPASIPPTGTTTPPSSVPSTPPAVPSACYLVQSLGQPGGIPAAPNRRWFRGDFCGVTVPGLPAVAGGAADPSVVLSPFLDRYSLANQGTILDAHRARGYTQFKLWWPDSRDGNGQTEDQFVATMQMVLANGMWPVPFLYSKVYDGFNPPVGKNDSLIAKMIAGGVAQIVCVGGELDLFNTVGNMQALIDHIAGLMVPATNLYVHFASGVTLDRAFWLANVNKLTGILYQIDPSWDCGTIQLNLQNLAAQFGLGVGGYPTNNGFGHPFDIVADEYSATRRFAGSMDEATAQGIGNQAICTPGAGGVAAPIPIMGYNNGGPFV